MELASAGGAATILWIAVVSALARIWTDHSLVRRSSGLATAAAALLYAASAPQAPVGLRVGLPLAALVRGAWLWWRSRDWPRVGQEADSGRQGGRVRVAPLKAAALTLAASAPLLVALGGGRMGYVGTDFAALALFLAAFCTALRGPAGLRSAAETAMVLAFYLCAWREPSGFLSFFAVLAATAMSPGTQLEGARREKAPARSAGRLKTETVLDA